ncbi:MAG: BREX-1 system adenine-specific DNA-methyltransferase PglX [Mesorhizobium sp.]|nr:MAG: BREX-1 system adenine-specific DNA-methyltransferase PglX [Mesorhizobium sp.]
MDTATPKKLDTAGLKKFAQVARRSLMQQVVTKLDHVLADGSAARRENPKAVKELEGQIATNGKEQVIDRVAYTWFNRFSALRFMDVNGHTRVGVLSPGEGQTRPEILAEAAAGHIDQDIAEGVREEVAALLDGRRPSRDPQAEAYRLLLVAMCNQWHQMMPFLFEKIADYTELLMPEDLLSSDSILAHMREVMTAEACRDVEIIGWLYQFYISEKKDQVFAGLKKNQKITPENIPAATQLFTPHWIVRYLVENSLGRLWMLNRPGSKLTAQMDYYISQEEPEKDFLRISSPEEIKVCDPACGSGHMLTYAFDLLYAIYEEEGYDPSEIPDKILTHNLYGVEIDERAGALAAFALVMKAAGRRKRFLRRPVQPNVCVLENVVFEDRELAEYMAEVGRDLFTADLRETLQQFAEAKNFGSLVVPKLKSGEQVARVIASKQLEGNLFLRDVHARVQTVLRMTDYLSSKYHVVVANPPYMGKSGMNNDLAAFLKSNFSDGKSDLMTGFLLRGLTLVKRQGLFSAVTLDGWMFLNSYENLRKHILLYHSIETMLHIGWNCFPDGHLYNRGVGITFSVDSPGKTGTFVRLADLPAVDDRNHAFLKRKESRQEIYRKIPSDFQKIPGFPISYWISMPVENAFKSFPAFSEAATACQGLATTDNSRFIREWSEVDFSNLALRCESTQDAISTNCKWFPIDKGGAYRKWYGNNSQIVNWKNDGDEIRKNIIRKYTYLNGNPDFVAKNPSKYFLHGVTWGKVTSGEFSSRYSPAGAIFSDAGMKAFEKPGGDPLTILGLFNSKVTPIFLSIFSETINYEQGNIARIPFATVSTKHLRRLVELSKSDWDANENSWDFTTLPLLDAAHRQPSLGQTYAALRKHWQGMTDEVQQLEEENNRIFIDAYGLTDELTPQVPLEEITLNCNPAYRFGGKKTPGELEALLLADTLRAFLSYAVGCMFGRYSLDAPGLILANRGQGFKDYMNRISDSAFSPDVDNVIPILDGAWFSDDITERFRKFLRTTFGEDHFAENLAFIETALGKEIRRYFLRDFYDDHVRHYKKRPIYWLFSSSKGTFNALIYMHRYRPDTVGTVLDYLREFRRKLDAHRNQLGAISISSASMQAEKVKALKEIETVSRNIDELDGYERDVLYPLATQRLEIDLDDGVKVNYARFGSALKPIKGLAAEEE